MSATFTNEPANSTVYYDCPFSDNPCGMLSRYPAGFSYASPGGSGMVSGPRVMDEYMLTGSTQGNGQWGLDFARRREIFVGFLWRTTARGYPNNNNKLVFIKDPSNSFLVWQGAPGTGAKRLKWYQQEGVDNCHVNGYVGFFTGFCWNASDPAKKDGTGWFEPNINASAADVAPDASAFTKVEIYLKASSTATSKDGIIRIWVNGTLSTEYTNVNQGNQGGVTPGGFGNVEITSTWDGQYQVPGPDWHHYFDHFYVSFPNNSGGVITPPVDPDPEPEPGTNDPLPAPTGLSPAVTTVSPGLVTVSWNQVSGASAYDLRIHKNGTPYQPCESMVRCARQSGTSYTFTADPNSTYDWWVHSVAPGGVAGPSNGTAFSTSSGVTPPVNPNTLTDFTPGSTLLQVGDVRSMTVTVSGTSASVQTVLLSNTNPTALLVPPSVDIQVGALTASFNVTALAAGTGTVTATMNSSVRSVQFNATAVPTTDPNPPTDPNPNVPPDTPEAPITVVAPSNPLNFVACHRRR